jgi:Uma2 family endonuclease
MASRSTTKLTCDKFFAMFPEDDGVHRELIGGEIFVTPSPATRHERLLRRLVLSLGNHLEVHPEQGEMFMSRFDVVISPYDVVEPDLLVVLGDQAEILNDKNIRGTPGLIVEIFSPSTRKRDQTLKRQLFDREGVREYWMVDPDHNEIAVYRRAADGSFPQAASITLGAGETLTTNLLPGWSLAVGHLFR